MEYLKEIDRDLYYYTPNSPKYGGLIDKLMEHTATYLKGDKSSIPKKYKEFAEEFSSKISEFSKLSRPGKAKYFREKLAEIFKTKEN